MKMDGRTAKHIGSKRNQKSGEDIMWRKKIERAYQRAMDIRDSTPAGPNFNEIESKYLAAYQRAYRSNEGKGFSAVTRRYLAAIRKDSKN